MENEVAQQNLETAFQTDPDLRDLYEEADPETKLDILDLFTPGSQGLYVRVRPTRAL